jgi:hypothetical protein
MFLITKFVMSAVLIGLLLSVKLGTRIVLAWNVLSVKLGNQPVMEESNNGIHG